jgi:hypothetical protein
MTCLGGFMKRQHEPKGRGPIFAGQAGDDHRLPDSAETDSESVEERVNEGQFFEATVVDGVEDISDSEVAEVRTRQVPVDDDVPPSILTRTESLFEQDRQ